jgi:monothiol glutaredoxin
MKQPKIIAWLKPACGWSNGVRTILNKYQLSYEERDIINHPAYYREMVEKTGQPFSPCVAVDDHLLADVSGEEVETWLIEHRHVQPSPGPAGAPTNQPCPGPETDVKLGRA